MRDDKFFNAVLVKYGYAITAHKAQGSEWKSVIVQVNENELLNPSEEKLRWLYTAITRARNNLFICLTSTRIRKERKPRTRKTSVKSKTT